MARYLVTGATGHLGNVTTKKLVRLGHSVCVLLLPGEDITPLQGAAVEIVHGDIRDKAFLQKHIASGDIVIHMAGVIDVASKKNELLMNVNVGGTKNIADVCAERGARLVYTSSVHVIQPHEGIVLTEPTVFDETKIAGAYAKSKTIATRYLFEKCKQGLDACVVYPAGIIGPCDYKVSNMGQVIWDHINHRLLAYVQGGYNFVDVRDVADGVIAAAQKGRAGEGYILSGEYCSVLKLIGLINQKIGRTRVPPKIPLEFAKLTAPLGEFYYKMRRKKPSFSAYSLQTLQDNSNFSHEKAEKELGFHPRPVKESVFDAVDWLLERQVGGGGPVDGA